MLPIARTIAPSLILALLVASANAQEPPLTSDRLAALDRISSDSLRGHLSFLASDLLEGRDSPSKGLDLAAEYIAAQFRRAGLEPIGDDGYFQTAEWELIEPDRSSFRFEIAGEGPPISVDQDHVQLARDGKLDIAPLPGYKLDFATYAAAPKEALAGRALLIELPDPRKVDRDQRDAVGVANEVFRIWAASTGAALIVDLGRDANAVTGLGAGRLNDPKAPEATRPRRGEPEGRVPSIRVVDPALAALFDASPAGPLPRTFALHLGEPSRRPVKLRNVAGLLRGSDPVLKDTYVMVTAHYDHIGVRGPAGTDRIFNGANDDGSGTVSVVELASALATLKERPKRSLVFLTFFGEEHGLLGSQHYGRNPLVPVDRTIADVNLEQVGRTDSQEGPQFARASLTGFGYSGVSEVFVAAGRAEGVEVYRHPRNSDAYFGASDNQALADLGVPAHTLCVAYAYADYHGAGDHWEKLDYANMARVDRVVARALLTLADDPVEPRWDEANPRAEKYLKAWKSRRDR